MTAWVAALIYCGCEKVINVFANSPGVTISCAIDQVYKKGDFNLQVLVYWRVLLPWLEEMKMKTEIKTTREIQPATNF